VDTKAVIGGGLLGFSYVVAPIITAFILRAGYREELAHLMAGPSPSVPNAPAEQKGTTARIRSGGTSRKLPAILSGPAPVFRLLLYASVSWLVILVIMPTVAPLLGVKVERTSLVPDLTILATVLMIVLLVARRVALGYSGLGLYSFFMGSAVSIMLSGSLIAIGTAIYKLFDGTFPTLSQVVAWLVGLPIMIFVLAQTIRFLLFVSKVVLWLHVGVDRLPVGPGFKACSFACMCLGGLFVLFIVARVQILGWDRSCR
jgi:hypothetical protein